MKNKEYENIVEVPLSPIGEDELDANSVGEVTIKDGSITAKKIRAGQILTEHLAAGSVTADKIFSNAISTYSLTVASRVKGSTVVFNVVSDGTYLRKLTWTSGVLSLSKVIFGEGENLGDITETTVSQSISSGYYTFTDSDSEYYFYVVWEADDNGEPKDSATLTVQKSQEYPMTQNAVPLIYAWYDSTLKMVQFRAVNSINGVLISGNSIIAGSIQADNIKAGTITVDKIKAGTITTDRLNFAPYVIGTNTLDDVVNGTTYKRVKSAAIDANGMILLDQTTDGTYSKVLSTDIQAGHIKLDSVIDGTYGKMLSTDIYAGHIKLTTTVDSSGSPYFSDSNGFLKNTKGTAITPPSGAGLYLGASYMGFYNGSQWKTYMDSSGNFKLSGSGSNSLTWDGVTLTIVGSISSSSISSTTISGGSITSTSISSTTISASDISSSKFSTSTYLNRQIIIDGKGTVVPDVEFWYNYSLDHSISEDANGQLQILGSQSKGINLVDSGGIYITNGILYVNGAGITVQNYVVVYGSSTFYGSTTFNSSVTVNATLTFGTGYGIKFNSTGTGGSFWYDSANGVLKFIDKNGNTKTISYT